jgi:hypothetical protein
MSVTREQVADLCNQDVVRLTNRQIPGLAIEGKLYEVHGVLGLCSWMPVRRTDGEPAQNWAGWDLTVISRAPRILYVNHPRREPIPGDVAVAGDGTGSVALRTVDGWVWPNRLRLRARIGDHGLHLLVDGETGQVVP